MGKVNNALFYDCAKWFDACTSVSAFLGRQPIRAVSFVDPIRPYLKIMVPKMKCARGIIKGLLCTMRVDLVLCAVCSFPFDVHSVENQPD